MRITLILLAVLLGACGQRGPLYFAERPTAPTPVAADALTDEGESQDKDSPDSPTER